MSHLKGYVLGKELGEGGFCKVRLGVHRLSGAKVAVKVIDKLRLSGPAERKRMLREVRVMRRLCSGAGTSALLGTSALGGGRADSGIQSNALPASQRGSGAVIRMFDVIDTASKVYIIMEYAPCGSLLDYVRGRKRVGEPEARKFLAQTLAGLRFCHANNIIHRDMKLENLLLDDDLNIKIIDFGLSAMVVPGKRLRVHCGSPSYAAPEIVSRREYDGPPVDVWSLGVVLFAMTAGYLPFHARNNDKRELCNKIVKGAYKLPDGIMSADLQNLIRKMLTVDPARRITLDGIASHAWMVQRKPATPVSSANGFMHTSSHGVGAGAGGGGGIATSSFRQHRVELDGADVQYNASPAAVDTIAVEGIYSAYNSLGEIEVDYDVVDLLVGHGFDADEVIDDVLSSECNYVTTAYYLFMGKRRREDRRKAKEVEHQHPVSQQRQEVVASSPALDTRTDAGSAATSMGIVDRCGEELSNGGISSYINDDDGDEEMDSSESKQNRTETHLHRHLLTRPSSSRRETRDLVGRNHAQVPAVIA